MQATSAIEDWNGNIIILAIYSLLKYAIKREHYINSLKFLVITSSLQEIIMPNIQAIETDPKRHELLKAIEAIN